MTGKTFESEVIVLHIEHDKYSSQLLQGELLQREFIS